jgi:putative ABC transport system ATP-binding protein
MISLQNVSKRYFVGGEWLTVLDQVNVTIEEGEFVSIMGPSGSGKSTLMHILGCLDLPTEGDYWFRDTKVSAEPLSSLANIRNREIGFVFQNFHLLPRMSAARNVELPMIYGGVPKAERRMRTESLLREMGLDTRMGHKPSELSGGQKQRVAIARALANQPSLVLADEPTGALDSATGKDIMALFGRMHAAGSTIVIITHDEQVARAADRIIRVADGRIMSEGETL